MFQYAAARALAVRHGHDIRFDTRFYQTDEAHSNFRQFLLNCFNVEGREASPEDYRKFFLINHPKLYSLFSRIGRRFHKPILRYYFENNLDFDPQFLNTKGSVFLNGYWQCESYFRNIKELLKTEFNPCEPQSGLNAQFIRKIKERASVAIHIRRGDYLLEKNMKIHGICSLEYYRKALEKIKGHVRDPKFYIFTDDPDFVKMNFKLIADFELVQHNQGQMCYWDLMLMRACKHHIISNSTFSWWGAWLSDEEQGIKIAPDPWFLGEVRQPTDLIPSTWTRIRNQNGN